ncbi:hypothetical protein EVAR_94550_1 [Eumeta japonica]|uniref:Uncharacterized protein n=1 Tax=Eumeta variegata TaxID=151549 RepID=A0A4C1UUT3_EUMVA|nr:hypothetical protein EVAR_94550_1 [Eumeta japonica]
MCAYSCCCLSGAGRLRECACVFVLQPATPAPRASADGDTGGVGRERGARGGGAPPGGPRPAARRAARPPARALRRLRLEPVSAPATARSRAVAARAVLHRSYKYKCENVLFDSGKILEDMRLNKEWEIHFDVDVEAGNSGTRAAAPAGEAAPAGSCANFIAVYCAKLATSRAV